MGDDVWLNLRCKCGTQVSIVSWNAIPSQSSSGENSRNDKKDLIWGMFISGDIKHAHKKDKWSETPVQMARQEPVFLY